MSKIAIYPGTFDPITFGHIDVIKKSLKLFDKVVVGVSDESNKNYLFSSDERIALVNKALFKDLKLNRKKIKEINSPINGWFSHENPFDFKQEYSQTHSIEKFRSGTPHILSMSTMIDSLNITLLAGTKNIDTKREKMIDFFNFLYDAGCQERTPALLPRNRK